MIMIDGLKHNIIRNNEYKNILIVEREGKTGVFNKKNKAIGQTITRTRRI